MAVSKLWPVTVRLATVLDYAANPEKTTKAKSKYSNADYQALRDVVNYVTVSYTHLDVYKRQIQRKRMPATPSWRRVRQ